MVKMLGKHYIHMLLIAELDYDKFMDYITLGHNIPEWLDEYYIQVTKSYYVWKMRNYD